MLNGRLGVRLRAHVRRQVGGRLASMSTQSLRPPPAPAPQASSGSTAASGPRFRVMRWLVLGALYLGSQIYYNYKYNLPEDAAVVLKVNFQTSPAQPNFQDPETFQKFGQLPTFEELILTLEQAAKDNRVKGVVATLSDISLSWAHAQEIRLVLSKLRKQGKFTVLHADTLELSTAQYYLASGFEHVFLSPAGSVNLVSFYFPEFFFKHFLTEKLGIQPQFGQREQYKSMGDTFMSDAMTDAQRENLLLLGSSLLSQLVAGVASGRALPPGKVRELVATGPFIAQDALRLGLVDFLAYEPLVKQVLKAGGKTLCAGTSVDKLVTHARQEQQKPTQDFQPEAMASLTSRLMECFKREDHLRFLDVQSYINVLELQRKESEGVRIPIINLDGNMSKTSVAPVIQHFRRATQDPTVAVVVFRIDTRGGEVLAADSLWEAVRDFQRKGKKVVVSMGGVAASGGYYVAAPADHILASPATLTGSIGVVGGKVSFHSLLQDKLGVGLECVSVGGDSGSHSSIVAPYSQEQWERVDHMLDTTYDDFLHKVQQGRQFLSRDQVRAVAGGRVWTGEQAKEVGLVDSLGGLSEAVAVAKSFLAPALAEKARVLHYSKDFAGLLLGGFRRGEEPLFSNGGGAAHAALAAQLLSQLPAPFRSVLSWCSWPWTPQHSLEDSLLAQAGPGLWYRAPPLVQAFATGKALSSRQLGLTQLTLHAVAASSSAAARTNSQ